MRKRSESELGTIIRQSKSGSSLTWFKRTKNRKPKMKRNKLLARFIALHGVRNSKLEELHTGKFPGTNKADYSDVMITGPYGEIKWNEVSRISDREMRLLMLDIEAKTYSVLEQIPKLEKEAGSTEAFEKGVKAFLFDQLGASWDVPEQEIIKRYEADYKTKLKISK